MAVKLAGFIRKQLQNLRKFLCCIKNILVKWRTMHTLTRLFHYKEEVYFCSSAKNTSTTYWKSESTILSLLHDHVLQLNVMVCSPENIRKLFKHVKWLMKMYFKLLFVSDHWDSLPIFVVYFQPYTKNYCKTHKLNFSVCLSLREKENSIKYTQPVYTVKSRKLFPYYFLLSIAQRQLTTSYKTIFSSADFSVF